MHTPKSSTLYELELNDHAGPDSLDMIIRRVYDRRSYQGQQVGDMLPNDSYHEWDLSTEEDVEECLLGYDESGQYVLGGAVQRWLNLPQPVYAETPYGDTPTWKGGYWGEGHQYYLDYIRDLAPNPKTLLADLIRRGEMPYGRYLIHCWW